MMSLISSCTLRVTTTEHPPQRRTIDARSKPATNLLDQDYFAHFIALTAMTKILQEIAEENANES